MRISIFVSIACLLVLVLLASGHPILGGIGLIGSGAIGLYTVATAWHKYAAGKESRDSWAKRRHAACVIRDVNHPEWFVFEFRTMAENGEPQVGLAKDAKDLVARYGDVYHISERY